MKFFVRRHLKQKKVNSMYLRDGKAHLYQERKIKVVLSFLRIIFTEKQIEIKKPILSYDVTSGSEIMPCNKTDKPLVVYRFTGNVMTSITTFDHKDKIITFLPRNEISKYLSYDK